MRVTTSKITAICAATALVVGSSCSTPSSASDPNTTRFDAPPPNAPSEVSPLTPALEPRTSAPSPSTNPLPPSGPAPTTNKPPVAPTNPAAGRAATTAAKTTIANLSSALNAFEIDAGAYPRNLDGLVHQPVQAPGWRGPYIQGASIPKDPWGNDFNYQFPGVHNPMGFDLVSPGPDGLLGNDDDLENWQSKPKPAAPVLPAAL